MEKNKRGESGLFSRLEKEAFRHYLKSEAYTRALALNLEEVCFEMIYNLDSYKYGLDKIVYYCRLNAGDKKKIKTERIEVYSDIGFLRYFSIFELLEADIKHSLHITGWKHLSNMRASELELLGFSNVIFEVPLDREYKLKNCELKLSYDMKLFDVKQLRTLLDTFKRANLQYCGSLLILFTMYEIYDEIVDTQGEEYKNFLQCLDELFKILYDNPGIERVVITVNCDNKRSYIYTKTNLHIYKLMVYWMESALERVKKVGNQMCPIRLFVPKNTSIIYNQDVEKLLIEYSKYSKIQLFTINYMQGDIYLGTDMLSTLQQLHDVRNMEETILLD